MRCCHAVGFQPLPPGEFGDNLSKVSPAERGGTCHLQTAGVAWGVLPGGEGQWVLAQS